MACWWSSFASNAVHQCIKHASTCRGPPTRLAGQCSQHFPGVSTMRRGGDRNPRQLPEQESPETTARRRARIREASKRLHAGQGSRQAGSGRAPSSRNSTNGAANQLGKRHKAKGKSSPEPPVRRVTSRQRLGMACRSYGVQPAVVNRPVRKVSSAPRLRSGPASKQLPKDHPAATLSGRETYQPGMRGTASTRRNARSRPVSAAVSGTRPTRASRRPQSATAAQAVSGAITRLEGLLQPLQLRSRMSVATLRDGESGGGAGAGTQRTGGSHRDGSSTARAPSTARASTSQPARKRRPRPESARLRRPGAGDRNPSTRGGNTSPPPQPRRRRGSAGGRGRHRSRVRLQPDHGHGGQPPRHTSKVLYGAVHSPTRATASAQQAGGSPKPTSPPASPAHYTDPNGRAPPRTPTSTRGGLSPRAISPLVSPDRPKSGARVRLRKSDGDAPSPCVDTAAPPTPHATAPPPTDNEWVESLGDWLGVDLNDGDKPAAPVVADRKQHTEAMASLELSAKLATARLELAAAAASAQASGRRLAAARSPSRSHMQRDATSPSRQGSLARRQPQHGGSPGRGSSPTRHRGANRGGGGSGRSPSQAASRSPARRKGRQGTKSPQPHARPQVPPQPAGDTDELAGKLANKFEEAGDRERALWFSRALSRLEMLWVELNIPHSDRDTFRRCYCLGLSTVDTAAAVAEQLALLLRHQRYLHCPHQRVVCVDGARAADVGWVGMTIDQGGNRCARAHNTTRELPRQLAPGATRLPVTSINILTNPSEWAKTGVWCCRKLRLGLRAQ